MMEEAVVEETSYLTTTLIAGTLLYLSFYVYKVVHRPMLIGCEGEFKSRLNKLDILNEYYWPTFWAIWTHFQTIFPALLKSKPHVPYRR